MTRDVSREIGDLINQHGEPDLQNDVIDNSTTGLEGEIDRTREQDDIEKIDVLQALRELQVGDPIRWKIFRTGEMDDKRNGYLTEWTTGQLTQEQLAKTYGGGTYKIRGTFSNGAYAGQRTVRIAGDVLSQGQGMQAAPGGFNMTEWLAMQQQMEERRESRDAERRRDSEGRTERLMAIFAPVLGTIATAVFSRATPAAPDVAALITALRPSVMPPDSSTQMKNTLETMVMMKKIMGGGSDDSDSLVEIVKAVAPHAGPALAALAANRNTTPVQPHMRARVLPPGVQPTQPIAPKVVQAPPISSQPQPVVVQPTPHTGVDLNAPSQPVSQETRDMFAQLKPQVDQLVTMAREGADPQECARVFYDVTMKAVDDNAYGTLCEFFENPKAIDQISIFNTGVREQRPFFEAFQKTVVELIVTNSGEAPAQS